MKATELRIGNYVNDEAVVNGIIKGTVYVNPTRKIISKGIAFSYRYSQIKPIPLTEQWLRDFGFRQQMLNAWTIKGFPLLELINNIGYPQDYLLSILPQVKYVHQLQNLYFALTGKELIKKVAS